MFSKLTYGLVISTVFFCFIEVAIAAPLYGVTLRAAVNDQSGLIDNNFNEQVVSQQLSAVGTQTRVINGQSTVINLESFSSANLATGQLKHRSVCTPLIQNCAGTASWFDTLTFDLTSFTQSEFVTLGVSASVDGVFGVGSQANFVLSVTGSFADLRASVAYRTSQETDSTDSPENFLTFTRAGNFSVFGPDEFVGSLELQGGGVRTLRMAMVLTGDTNVDFSNTATFGLNSPVSFSSASGVFLSEQQTILVSEPTSLALLLIGLIGISAGMHGAKRRNQS